MINILTFGLIKKLQLHKMSHFAEPHTYRKIKIEVELELSNYAKGTKWFKKFGK